MQAQSFPPIHSLFGRYRVILRVGVAAGTLIAVIVAHLIVTHLHQEAEERAAVVTRNLTQSVDQTIAGLIDTIDVALLASSDEICRQMSAGKTDGASITRFLVRQKEHLHHVAYLRATNERGEVVYGPGIPTPPASSSDRDFFIGLRDDPNADLFIAKPVVGRISGKWVWMFARRINGPDGSFGGVVFAALYIDEIEHILAQIGLEPGSVISVRDAELGLIAHNTFGGDESIPPGDRRLSTTFKEALKANPQEGTFVSDKTTPDGVSRTHSYRRNPDHGFTVNVGLARAPMLAERRYQFWTAAGLVSAFILLSLSYSLLLNRTWRRKEQITTLLEDSRNRLQKSERDYSTLVNNIPDFVMRYDRQHRHVFANEGCIRSTGMTREEFLGKTHREAGFPENLCTLWEQAIDRCFATKTQQTEVFEWESAEGALVLEWRVIPEFEEDGLVETVLGISRNITEQKHLQQEREQYFKFFHLTTDAMCIADPFGCFKRINPAFIEMTGYGESELVAKPFLDFILPEDRERTAEEMKLQVAVRPSMHFENRYVCKDGKIIVLSWTAYFDKSDGVTYATARDITELRMAEESLERFFTLVPDLMCIASLKGYFLKFNPAWPTLLGYSEQEIASTPYINFVHPDDQAATTEAVAHQMAGEAILNFVNRFRCKDGTYRWLEWRTTPALTNAVVFATARDITERMRMEEALRESEARFRYMFEHNDSVMLLIDPDSGEIIDANAAATRFYGYPAERLKFMRIDQINTLAPEEIAEKRAQVAHNEDHVFIFPHRLASGEVRTVEVRSSPIEVGSRVLLFSIVNDVSAREKATAELERSNSELEQFSYAVSHDMRQPLRMISSYLQLLAKELAEHLDDEKREYFDFAVDGAKRLDQMLVGLLEYSRVGRIGEPAVGCESRSLLDDALLILQPAIDEAQARLAVIGDWPKVFVSRDEVLRLMQNLIGNAIKFRVAGRTPEIAIASETIDKVWRLSVSDNGVGIVPGQIGRLFQVFQRLQSRAAFDGSGIGLALCRKIAEHHGGRIWAESAGEGQGSTFRVEFPDVLQATGSDTPTKHE
ncbi:MAG: PAS domain S-box protein [Sterolibacterium sp.]|nr:PAS domain S-box protein [Sterolibacterium sp.]